MMPAKPPQNDHPKPKTHGLGVMKKALKVLGSRSIDHRTRMGKALAAWRAELIEDLGGEAAVSTQQAAIVELAVRTKLMLDSVDAWVLTHKGGLVDKRKRAVLPVVRERQALADALARYMGTLGLERRAKPALSLTEYIAERYGKPTTSPQESP